jgi:uncharacterized protein (TIGR02145 family)
MKNWFILSIFLVLYNPGVLLAQLFGGQLKSSSSTYPTGTVHCKPQSRTAVVEVTNPTTGETWMDRNLGAERVATSTTDELAFGDLYQWGRGADGHHCRNSGTLNGPSRLSSTLHQPGHDDFLLISTSSTTDDWRTPQSNLLWQGVGGVNNPCPAGFSVPTEAEFTRERQSWTGGNNSSGAFNSVLKLPLSGFRERDTGIVSLVDDLGRAYGMLWTSTVVSEEEEARFFAYWSSNAFVNSYPRSRGYSVRCIKN